MQEGIGSPVHMQEVESGWGYLESTKGCISCLRFAFKTVWPSGLRRWLKAPFRKGVGSNPTAVNADQLKPPLAPWYSSWSPHPTPKSQSRDSGHGSCFGGRHRIGGACGSYIECAAIACMHDSLAERSKAVAQGAIP